MDVVVSRAEDSDAWTLADLLGRPMGIIRRSEQQFVIEPAGGAVESMGGMARTHGSLDAALARIESHTRGVCRRDWENSGEES